MKKRANYWKKAAAAALVLVFLLSACGASTANSAGTAAREDYYAVDAQKAAGGSAYNEAVTEEAYSSSYRNDSYDTADSYDEWDEDAEMESLADEAAPMAAAESGDGGASVSTDTPADGAEQADLKSPNRKIVYTGNVSLQTLEYDKSSQSIHDKITQSGGFIESEDTYNEDPYWYYSDRSGAAANKTRRNLNITARIPADEFDGFMKSLEEDGQVTNTSVNARNISVSYATHDASRKALEIEKKRLLEMMDKAETVEEMITVERRLTQVERELGDEMTQLSAMDRDVDFSTVYISLQEVFEYSEKVVEVTFGERLQRAFGRAGESFVTFWEDVLLFIAETFPFLIMWGIVIFFAAKLIRRHRRRGQEKRAILEEERRRAMQAAASGTGGAGACGMNSAGMQTGDTKKGGLKGLFGRRRTAEQPLPASVEMPSAEIRPEAAQDKPAPATDRPEAPQDQPSPVPEAPQDQPSPVLESPETEK